MSKVMVEVRNVSQTEVLRIFRPLNPANPADENGSQGDEIALQPGEVRTLKADGRMFLDVSNLNQPVPAIPEVPSGD